MKDQLAVASDLGSEISLKMKNIDDVILFGSVARGEDNRESDIDLLLVTNHFDPNIHRLSTVASAIVEPLIRYGSFVRYGESNKKIHILYCSESDLNYRSPILDNIRHEGISLL